MLRSFVLCVSLVVVACGPVSQPGAAAAEEGQCQARTAVGGETRLKPGWYTGEDGERVSTGTFWDQGLEVECKFQDFLDGSVCMPLKAINYSGLPFGYSDPECTSPVFNGKNYFIIEESRVFKALEPFTERYWVKNSDGSCVRGSGQLGDGYTTADVTSSLASLKKEFE